jgi:hypothetical protein
MLKVDTYIEIGKYKFDYLTEVEVNSSWKNLTDTGILKLPRKLLTKDKEQLQNVIKRSDKILIKTGYDGELNTIFTGYVAYIKANIPLEIELEDEMFKHKQKSVQAKSWKSATVDDVLKYLGISKYETFGVIDLGTFQIDANIKNEAGVFDKIKQQYGLPIFYKNDTLIVGKPYGTSTATEHTFAFQHNIISSDLEYRTKDELRIKVKAISNLDNGKKETIELGDADGEEHTLNFYNLSISALKKHAEAEMEKLKHDGYRGSFKTFGMPKVSIGDIAIIKDNEYPERAGKFYVDSVKYTCSVSDGLRQEIELGPKANK